MIEIRRAALIILAAMAVGCGDSNDDAHPGSETVAGEYSPNLWMWWSRHYSGRSYPTFALFDDGTQPAALIVGRVARARNVGSEFFSFELRREGTAIHLKSFGAFQPHANCIAGDFKFAVDECPTDSEFERCASLIDLESGHEIKMYSFPEFNVSVPRGWNWEYSADDTLGDTLDDYIDLRPMLERMKDKSYVEDRERVTSRFLRGAFNVRAQLNGRLVDHRVRDRRCLDTGRDVLRALKGEDNHRFISIKLPDVP